MKRWWTLPVLPAVVFGLGLSSEASASTHCTVSIIMTTLGTDGTSVSQTITVPPNSNVSINAGGPAVDTAVPGTSTPASGPGSSPGGGSGGGSGSGGSNAQQNTPPSAATGNPADTPSVPDSDSVPVPTDDEPTPPAPPILVPDVPTTPIPGDVIPVPGPGPVDDDVSVPPSTDPMTPVAEAPEPGTLTLLGLAAIGGIGYARRKRKVV